MGRGCFGVIGSGMFACGVIYAVASFVVGSTTDDPVQQDALARTFPLVLVVIFIGAVLVILSLLGGVARSLAGQAVSGTGGERAQYEPLMDLEPRTPGENLWENNYPQKYQTLKGYRVMGQEDVSRGTRN